LFTNFDVPLSFQQNCLRDLTFYLLFTTPHYIEISKEYTAEFENKIESLTIALEEMEEEMHFVSTSLEQSVKVTENLTLSEANLREELMNVIDSNTEEMNAMICSHNETMKKTEEKLFLLEIQNKELKDKINQKSGLFKKQKRGIKNSIKVISDDEESESEIEDEDTIDVNKTQCGFFKNDLNVSRKSEGRATTVRLSSLLCNLLI
jgi:hypothetical protein